MGLVIDTSAIVDVERGAEALGGDAGAWEPLLARTGDPIVVLPAIVYAEVLVGVALAGNTKRAAERRARLDALTEHVAIVDFDADVAQVWARLFAALQRSGQMIPTNDLAVAATAKHLDYGVLAGVSGEKHFRTVEGLTVITISGES